MVLRHRTRESIAFRGDYNYWNGFWDTPGILQFNNSAEMYDGVHGPMNTSGDWGGNMTQTVMRWDINPCNVRSLGPGGKYSWGPLIPQHMYVSAFEENQRIGLPGAPSELDLVSMGTTAIARVLPTNPSFSASQAIGELRNDGLPRIPGSELRERAKYLKKSGSEYLNVEFGWLPLVSDLKNFAHAVKNSHEILQQYRKQSDTKIRRGYSFPSLSSSFTWKTGDPNCGYAVSYTNDVAEGQGPGVQTSTRSARTWFSGAFRYHIPVGDDLSSKMARWYSEADKLLGVRLTPETVWNLAPWSWAVDWFTNTGDVIHNITRLGSDGLVMQYGYIMSESIYTRTLSATFPNSRSRTDLKKDGSCSHHYEEIHRVRREATPYGFGFNMATLTASQDAVLVALGLSKGLR